MASPISTISFCCSSYVKNSKPTMHSIAPCSCSSYSLHLPLKDLNFSLSSRFSQMGFYQFTPWNGLRHMGISISPKTQKIGIGGKCKGKVVYASLFGVGAPEALVIGVVALLVFGPKGLAEVARNLGKTLRAFQPTIKELQEVSREFKNTLEREISLDDDPSSMGNSYGSGRPSTLDQSDSGIKNSETVSEADPNGVPSNNAYSSEEYLKITEEELKASATAQQNAPSSSLESQIDEIRSQSQDSNPANGASSSEDYLKVSGEQQDASSAAPLDAASSQPESQIAVDSQTQGAVQETAVAGSQAQKPETET